MKTIKIITTAILATGIGLSSAVFAADTTNAPVKLAPELVLMKVQAVDAQGKTITTYAYVPTEQSATIHKAKSVKMCANFWGCAQPEA